VLALKTGATILPVYMFRQPDRTFESVVFPPIHPVDTGDRDRDTQSIMQRLMDTMQTVVRERPDQWYMFRPMWPNEVSPVLTGRETPTRDPARG
jgi:KDO2-lipid IV(A) lauroyltransferase